MLTVNEVWNVLNRTRPVQGIHCNKIGKLSRLELTHILLHSRTFVLKYPNSPAFLEELVRTGIIQWNFVRIDINPMSFTDKLNGMFDDRERPEPQEVHLQKSSIFCNRVIELRNEDIRIFGGNGNRYEIGNIFRCDDYTTGMNSGVADTAFHFLCCRKHLITAVFRVGQNVLHFLSQNPVFIPQLFELGKSLGYIHTRCGWD